MSERTRPPTFSEWLAENPDDPMAPAVAAVVLGDHLKPRQVPEDWPGALGVWRTGTIVITFGEIAGLDRQGFREMLRSKVQVLGDELLKEWEKLDAGGR